jgi:hypothetical protein
LSLPHLEVVALWLTYAGAAAATLWLARRLAAGFPRRAGVLLAVAPLVFTGKAMLLGRIYGPADLYYGYEPWKRVAAEQDITKLQNPILSDLAFANLPWRAAVREALVNGRLPFWNRFVLAGNPLLGTVQAAVLHPSTWIGIFLPVALSWTFSCTFTIFLALLAAFLFFLDFRLRPLPALAGAVGWGFSTYVLFWDGWSVGPAIATFPLLLLGLRRIASGGSHGVSLTAVALLLSLAGGHPETLLHGVAAGGIYFLWELPGNRGGIARPLRSALAAGVLALLLSGPQLFPLLETIRHSAEYRARSEDSSSARSQSVSASEAAARLLPAVLPFAHGIYGKSPVQAERNDGSGMPLGYAGAVLLALAVYGSLSRRRGRSLFLAFVVAGLLFGSSAPGLIDIASKMPGFSMALNYRLVFLTPLGLAGLAAFGTQRLCDEGSWKGLAVLSIGGTALLITAFLLSRDVFRERALPESFLTMSLAWEVLPVALLAAAALVAPRDRRVVLPAALALLVIQRAGEMGGVYPTLPAAALAPGMPSLAKLPAGPPYRIIAPGYVFRPNGAALYGLEDVRGYESLVLDRFADTYPLWSTPQFASFNRVDDPSRPFLSFLNVRFAFAPPDAPTPPLWSARIRAREMSVFENPRSLPRAFAPARIRFESDSAKTLSEMAQCEDYGAVAWVRMTGGGRAQGPPPQHEERVTNGTAEVSAREVGPDLLITVSSRARVFIATSLPDWPGWRGEDAAGPISLVTVNHAFVGFWLDPGRHAVRLTYRPAAFLSGLASFFIGLLASLAATLRRRGLTRS